MVDSEGGGAGVLLTETAMGRADNPCDIGQVVAKPPWGAWRATTTRSGLALQDHQKTDERLNGRKEMMRTPTLIIALMCCKTDAMYFP
jgi:hypothetical protein